MSSDKIYYKYVIECYQQITDERYIELYDSKEELQQGLKELVERDYDDSTVRKEIFEQIENKDIYAEGYEYIKIYETAIKF